MELIKSPNTQMNEFIQLLIDNDELYKETVNTINIFNVYLNKNREIVELKKTKAILNEPLLSKEQIIFMYKNHNKATNNKYKLIKLLSYHFDTNTDNLIDIINNNFDCDKFIKSHTIINDIIWDDTLHLFHSLNSLYFIYQEKEEPILITKTRKNKTNNNKFTRKKLNIQGFK